MHTALLILLSIIPALLLLLFFEKMDRGRKEPMELKGKIFWWGLFAVFIAIFLEEGVSLILFDWRGFGLDEISGWGIFLTAFVVAALIEEGLKLFVVKTQIYRDKNFDEVMDGISYTIIVSLGFATLENISYVLGAGDQAIQIGLMRAVLAVPAHAMFSGIMGYYIGRARFAQKTTGFLAKGSSLRLLLKGFFFAVLYHGTYNYLLFRGSFNHPELLFLVVPVMIIMGLHLKVKIRQAYFIDNVHHIPPEALTFHRISRAFFGSLLIVIGTAGFVYSYDLSKDPTVALPANPMYYGGLFAGVLLFSSYLILKKHDHHHPDDCAD